MALTSTLFTGLSGLDVNQTRLNVVGNNIANVNTVAFKSSRALFKPQFYVSDSAGSPASADFGGTNPSQRGLGAAVAAIEKDLSPGSIEPTGKPTDLAVDGDGYFVVQGVEQKFTRDGSFTLNSANELVTTSGDFVQGFGVDDNNQIIPGQVQNLVIPLGTATNAKATQNVTLVGNLNAAGAVAGGQSILNSQPLTVVGGAAAPDGTTALTSIANASAPGVAVINNGDVFTLSGKKGGRSLGDVTFTVGVDGTTLGDLMGFLNQGMGIDTSVAGTPAPGSTAEVITGDPAEYARLVVTGNTGTENELSLAGNAFTTTGGAAPFTFGDGTNAAGNLSNPTGESVHTSFAAYDSLGTPITVDVTAVLETKADTGNTWRFYATSGDDTDDDLVLGNGTLTFDNEGKLSASTGTTINIDRSNTGALTPLALNMDFDSMTSLTSRDSELVMTEQDGSPIGTLDSYSIGADGTIVGSYTNGLSQTLGQVALATFNNAAGLVDKGGNMYVTGADSGVPIIASPLTLGSGGVRSGSLELSNVDISKEFINLIISSTGFSASSRVITTSDQLLTELLNSAR